MAYTTQLVRSLHFTINHPTSCGFNYNLHFNTIKQITQTLKNI